MNFYVLDLSLTGRGSSSRVVLKIRCSSDFLLGVFLNKMENKEAALKTVSNNQ